MIEEVLELTLFAIVFGRSSLGVCSLLGVHRCRHSISLQKIIGVGDGSDLKLTVGKESEFYAAHKTAVHNIQHVILDEQPYHSGSWTAWRSVSSSLEQCTSQKRAPEMKVLGGLQRESRLGGGERLDP